MSRSAVDLILALAFGAGLGAWFFLGLLWTLRRLPSANHPVRLVLGSLIVRVGLVLLGFAWLTQEHWLLSLPALVGFVAVRHWTLKSLGGPNANATSE